jgi:hypothetical protein
MDHQSLSQINNFMMELQYLILRPSKLASASKVLGNLFKLSQPLSFRICSILRLSIEFGRHCNLSQAIINPWRCIKSPMDSRSWLKSKQLYAFHRKQLEYFFKYPFLQVTDTYNCSTSLRIQEINAIVCMKKYYSSSPTVSKVENSGTTEKRVTKWHTVTTSYNQPGDSSLQVPQVTSENLTLYQNNGVVYNHAAMHHSRGEILLCHN